MANTLKTIQGELLASEVEAVIYDNPSAVNSKGPMATTKVLVVGKSGIKYDLTTAIQGALAVKVLGAALEFVAGTGHTVFDPSKVK